MVGKLAALVTAGAFLAIGADDITLWAEASTDIAGPVAISQVVDAAYYDWLLEAGDWEETLARTGADLHRGTIEVDGTTVRWAHGDACWQVDASDPGRPGDPATC